ncbi:MAG: hypothetical protein HY370_04240 [Proteobacteria bacterium]|nr:hypothetical protein [Pseudomonadota bacterium]
MSDELLSQIAYAKRMGVSRQYIGELVQKGVLPLTDGQVDPAVADAIIEARREPARALRRKSSQQQETIEPTKRTIPTSELPTLLLKTRIKSETEKAKLLEIKAKVEAERFVDIEIVKAVGFKRGRIIRDGMLSIPDRLDAILAVETDRRKVHQILTDEINRVLEEFSKPIL